MRYNKPLIDVPKYRIVKMIACKKKTLLTCRLGFTYTITKRSIKNMVGNIAL